jgi:pimeloyl-ACP methyl ester carboxylesterase
VLGALAAGDVLRGLAVSAGAAAFDPSSFAGAVSGAPPFLAGHSLGGSLALLTAALARLRLGTPPASLAPVHAFGSPPVLALEREGAPPAARAAPPGAGVMQLLQLPPRAVRQFVLDTDPVPRMWSGACPRYGYLTAAFTRLRMRYPLCFCSLGPAAAGAALAAAALGRRRPRAGARGGNACGA